MIRCMNCSASDHEIEDCKAIRRAVRLSGTQIHFAPMAVSTRPIDWAPLAREILFGKRVAR